MTRILFLFSAFGFLVSYGQDTSKTWQRPGYKEWSDTRTVPRLAIGVQKSIYIELGFARHRFYFNDLGFASTAYYGAFEWTPVQNIYGLKGGYEVNARTLALGIEAKYQTDLENMDFILTPKIGLGAAGIVNIFYGFNISFNRLPFSSIGRHQFSVVFNYNRLAFKKAQTGNRRK